LDQAPSDIRFRTACPYITVPLIVMAAANRFRRQGGDWRTNGGGRGIVAGSPPKAFEAKGGEDFKKPVSSGR
jgi:hypothetical protein